MPAENRDRVLRAAAESFIRRGYQASVDEIARRAGVAKQTVYHHFASKDALFKAVAHELTRGVLVELESGDGDVRAGLAGLCAGNGLSAAPASVPWSAQRVPALAWRVCAGARHLTPP